MFYSAADLKGFGCSPVIVDWALHVVMEVDHTEQPIFSNSFNGPLLLTKSNDLVISMKAKCSDLLCLQHFSCSCRAENTMSVVDLPVLKPH